MKTNPFWERTAIPLFCAFAAGACTVLLALENERRQIQAQIEQAAQAAPAVIVLDCNAPGAIDFAFFDTEESQP